MSSWQKTPHQILKEIINDDNNSPLFYMFLIMVIFIFGILMGIWIAADYYREEMELEGIKDNTPAIMPTSIQLQYAPSVPQVI